MLTANLWTDAGLVNGAMGTIDTLCYQTSGPPNLPLAIMVKFDNYSGPTLSNKTIPIVPLRRTWFNGIHMCSRNQLPVKLARAITIHKAQGLTLAQAIVDIGKREFSSGLSFVACSRVRKLRDLTFVTPFDFERLVNIGKSQRLLERIQEDCRLLLLETRT